MEITRSAMRMRKTSSASLEMAFMCARKMAAIYLGMFCGTPEATRSSRDQ
jgi:hypothetical protein